MNEANSIRRLDSEVVSTPGAGPILPSNNNALIATEAQKKAITTRRDQLSPGRSAKNLAGTSIPQQVATVTKNKEPISLALSPLPPLSLHHNSAANPANKVVSAIEPLNSPSLSRNVYAGSAVSMGAGSGTALATGTAATCTAATGTGRLPTLSTALAISAIVA